MEEMGMVLTPEQAVKNGAEWLDKVYPEWWSRVDVRTLSIENIETCICGQLFSSTCHNGYIYISMIAPMDDPLWIENHGFAGYDKISNPLWVTEIKRRADIGLVD